MKLPCFLNKACMQPALVPTSSPSSFPHASYHAILVKLRMVSAHPVHQACPKGTFDLEAHCSGRGGSIRILTQ